MNKDTQHIICYFNQFGYRIESVETKDVLFESGNHRCDDHTVVNPNNYWALPMDKIIKFGSKTAIELAIENDLEYVGIEYEAMDDDEKSREFEVNANEYLAAQIPQFMFQEEYGDGKYSLN